MNQLPLSSAPEPTRVRWSAATDRGKVRKTNEDGFLALCFDAQELHYLGRSGEITLAYQDLIFAVSDGMGGELAGEFASKIALEKVAKLLPRAYKQAALGFDAALTEVLSELFEQIHGALRFVGGGYEETSGMGATLSLVLLTPGWLYFGHIGDSRLYYLPAGGGAPWPRALTVDDTHVGWLYQRGELNERQARSHPRRHILQKALGANNQFVEPQTGRLTYGRGDRFLLCTDGVIEGLFDAQMAELLTTPPLPNSQATPAERLVAAARESSGLDNTTALVVEILG